MGVLLLVMGTGLGIVLVNDLILTQRYLVPAPKPAGWHIAVPPLPRAAIWIALVPLVAWIAHRLPLEGPRRLQRLFFHSLIMLSTGLMVGVVYKVLWLDGTPYESGRWSIIYLPEWLHIYAVVVGVTYAFDAHARDLAKERRSRELRAQLAEAQLRALRHQLHPHFVFNTLQAVSTLMYRDVAAADRLIADLSALLRRLLNHLERDDVALAEEVAFVESYLAIERARLGDRLHVTVDVSPSLGDCTIPALLLQPLCENAVKHAALRRREGVRLRLQVQPVGERVEITVQDDGPGLPAGFGRDGFGVGLRTIEARLTAAYGSGGYRFSVQDVPEGGVCARIDLPRHGLGGAEAA